jgi:hypothetical protein
MVYQIENFLREISCRGCGGQNSISQNGKKKIEESSEMPANGDLQLEMDPRHPLQLKISCATVYLFQALRTSTE